MHYNTYVWGPSMPYTCKWHALSPYAPVHMCMSKIVTGPSPGPPVMDIASQYNSLSLSVSLSRASSLYIYDIYTYACRACCRSLALSLARSRALSLSLNIWHIHIYMQGMLGPVDPEEVSKGCMICEGAQGVCIFVHEEEEPLLFLFLLLRMHDVRGRPGCACICVRCI